MTSLYTSFLLIFAGVFSSFSLLQAQTTFTWNISVLNNQGLTAGENWEGGNAPNGTDAIADMYIDWESSGSFRIVDTSDAGAGTPVKLAGLIIGDKSGQFDLRLQGGGTSEMISLESTLNSRIAFIEKESDNSVTFLRGIRFVAGGEIINKGGILTFGGIDDKSLTLENNNRYSDIGEPLTIRGGMESHGITVFQGGQYFLVGEVVVADKGVLLINGKVETKLDRPYSNAIFQIQEGGKLGGVGRIDHAIHIASGGILSPGNPAVSKPEDSKQGILSVGGELILEGGSIYRFQLIENKESDRGRAFSGVDIMDAGSVAIEQGASLEWIADGEDSTVDYSSDFWKTNHRWLVIQSNSLLLPKDFKYTLTKISKDSHGKPFETTKGTLDVITDSGSIYLAYTAR